MYAAARQQAILTAARADGRVEVSALADALQVTPETVRRDLTALERLGALRRVHGGALPVERLELEPTLAARREHLADEKSRIAARALAELPVEGTVLLDAGSTTQALAERFPQDRELTVVTNSIAIAATLLGHPGVELYLLGGRIRPRTGAAVGTWASSALAEVAVDVAFLGTNGFSVSRGMTTPDQAEAVAKRAMVSSARRSVVLADSSKAEVVHFHRFATVAEIALLVTDRGLDEETSGRLEAAGTDVVRV